MRTWLESISEEVIRFFQENKEQHKTLNRVKNLLEQLCNGNGKQQLYTASTNTYKRKEEYLDITSKDNDTDNFYIKPGVSRSKPFE